MFYLSVLSFLFSFLSVFIHSDFVVLQHSEALGTLVLNMSFPGEWIERDHGVFEAIA